MSHNIFRQEKTASREAAKEEQGGQNAGHEREDLAPVLAPS